MPFYEEQMSLIAKPKILLKREGEGFWDEADPVVDATGKVIRGGMFEHQRTWWHLPNFIKVLVGGYGAGKTNIASKRAIAMALANAPAPVAVVSPSYALARMTTVATIKEQLRGKQTWYGRELVWKYNETNHVFSIKYRGRTAYIYILSGDKPDSLRGPNLSGALIDEPFIQPKEVFTQMVARVRAPEAKFKGICLTGTPEQLNWGYDLCIGEDKENQDVGTIFASTRANFALEKEYVGRLEGALSERAAQAYIDGKFINVSEGAIYYAFEATGKLTNVIEVPEPDGAELGCGMDFNVDPFTCAVFWRSGSHLHYFAEYEFPNADTESVCKQLREKHPKLNVIYPDASGNQRKTSSPEGKTDFWYIRQAGFEIRAKYDNPKVRDRQNAVNGKLKNRLGRTTLTISPKCKKLIKYLSLSTHENAHKDDQVRMGHLLDAFGYPIAFQFPVDKETLTGNYRLTGH